MGLVSLAGQFLQDRTVEAEIQSRPIPWAFPRLLNSSPATIMATVLRLVLLAVPPGQLHSITASHHCTMQACQALGPGLGRMNQATSMAQARNALLHGTRRLLQRLLWQQRSGAYQAKGRRRTSYQR